MSVRRDCKCRDQAELAGLASARRRLAIVATSPPGNRWYADSTRLGRRSAVSVRGTLGVQGEAVNLIFRLIKVLLGVAWRAPLGLLDESVVEFRVWPNDLDVNLHMNNGRYLTLMDLGRFDLIFRAGMLRQMVRRRWSPVAASATIRFRRSLKPFRPFRIRTRLACWDEQWIYFEQRFESEGRLVALGYVRALLRGGGRNVTTAEILRALGEEIQSPPMPESVALWRSSEATAPWLREGDPEGGHRLPAGLQGGDEAGEAGR
jgi:acyl-CoA thioesterase FadM